MTLYKTKVNNTLPHCIIFAFPVYALLILLTFSVSVTAEPIDSPEESKDIEIRTMANAEGIVHNQQNRQADTLTVEQLLSWNQWGKGYFGGFGRAVQMTEDPNSAGIMLVSPESYGTDVVINYEVMTLRPATVLVAMLSASNGDGSGTLDIPDDFDGNFGMWPKGATDYFFAFHNAPHFRKPFVNRRGSDEVMLLEEAERNYMNVGQWHQIEAGRSGNRVWLKIDGKTVLDATDSNPLDGGHLSFRIRGSGTERASCFIKDVVISTSASR